LIGVPESNQTNWRHALQSIVGPHSPYEYIFAKKSCHISCKSPVQDLVKSLQKDFGFYEDHNSYYTAHKKLFHRLFQGIGSPLVDEIEEMDRKLVEDLFKSGHLIFERRFGVTFIDTWDLNYTGQKKGMDSLHALMDLVNLLSYETDFIFTGTEKWIAMLYTEHTIQTMGGEEGKAITQMKQGSLKNLPRLKHQVTKDIYHQYLTHLHELGFQQTKTQITKIREHRTTSKAFIETSEPIEKMCDYFYCNHPNSTSLLLEVRGDFYGIQLTLVSLNEEDLDRWDLEGKNLKKSSALQGNQIAETLSWSKQYLTALSHRLIYEHTIRYFDCQLRDFYLSSGRSLNHQQQQLQETGQHLIKGIRTFIQAFPIPPSTNVSAGSILKTLQVELTSAHRLDSYCPEPVLLKVLLRYIASHAKRYEVCDLMRTGTPDAIFCRSSTGAFFHRTKKNDPTDSKKKTIMPQNQNGDYSLIITTLAVDRSSSFSSSQNKWVNVILIQSKPTATSVTLHDNTRRFLRRGSRPSNGSSSQNDRDRLGFDLGSHNNVLSVEQTLLEAQLFVQELFRVAACHYERDILWSRLLYSTSNVTARVASSLKLSQDHLQMEVGPEQLEECLSLSVCTPFEQLDPTFQNLLTLEGINWSEFALQVCDLYHDQVRQYHFEDGKCFHLLLLCLDARDLMLHLTFSTIENHIEMEICRREEPRNHTFTCEQRHVIGEFVNMLVHWLWRSLLYDP
jgi:hypothetical protein